MAKRLLPIGGSNSSGREIMQGGMGRTIWAIFLTALLAAPVGATPREERATLGKVASSLKAAERLAKANRPDDAIARFTIANDLLSPLASAQLDPRNKALLERVQKELTATRERLTKQGLKLPTAEEAAAAPLEVTRETPAGPPATPGSRSFVREVAPILVQQCGKCHVEQAKGQFNSSTYQSLMAAAGESGQIVQPGAGNESPLVTLIVNGKMPPGGREVPPEQVRTLVEWINEGAAFDGGDPTAKLTSLGPATSPSEPMTDAMPKVRQATGKETVSFALQVAPILADKCAGCHNAEAPDGGLNLASLAGLLKGGDSGEAVSAESPERSALYSRVTSQDESRMPPEGDPLPAEEITILETWIREGATFDGDDPSLPLVRVAAFARGEKLPAEELSKARAKLAAKNWKLALPDVAPQTFDTPQFHLIGTLPQADLTSLGALAEQQKTEIQKLLSGKEAKEFAKGRITLFGFAQRVEFSEFGRMVEGQPPAAGALSSSAYTGEDCYLALAKSDDDSLELAEQLTRCYLRDHTRGRMPEWFVQGVARTAAAKLGAKSERVATWRTNVPSVLATVSAAEEILSDRLPPESSVTARFAFAEALLKHRGGVQKYLQLLRNNRPAEEAFAEAYGGPAEGLVSRWLASVKK